MKVDKLTLNRIFDHVERFDAPVFQRPYVWERENNWEPLWESIKNICDKRYLNVDTRPHFMGTIVLDLIHTTTGKINVREIIDGQQRLTTFQLALAAIRDYCLKQNEKSYAETFETLTSNRAPLSKDKDDTYKIRPTNSDRVMFQRVMQAGSRVTVNRILEDDKESKMAEAYLYFTDVFEEWLGNVGTNEFKRRLEVLRGTLSDYLHIVVIDLEKDDDAQEIFETLNALGTPLLPADLVKNYLFHSAESEKLNVEDLYKKYWAGFDEEHNYWRKEITQGRYKKPRLDFFLGHYLTLMLADEIPSTQLFTTYKDYVQKEKLSIEQHMDQFYKYAEIYKRFDEFGTDDRVGVFFNRLEQLDTTTVYPLLLEVLNLFLDKDYKQLVDILIDLESYLVRRTICGFTTKHYNKLFVSLIKETKCKGVNLKNIRQYLLDQKSDVTQWPNDIDLLSNLKSGEFYKLQKRSRGRMILEALEFNLHTGKTESIEIKEKLTIEHLMPVEWEKHWPINTVKNTSEYKELEEKRNSAIHKIGNLTLLTKELNPSISNGPWVNKRKEILKHSALNLNRSLPDSWDEKEIDKRSEELFKVIKKTWPFPG